VTWTAPGADRTYPPTDEPDDRRSLEQWLEFHRATLLVKCAGLTGEQLALRAVPPSSLSLLGLVRHLADVERAWFRRRLDGQSGLGSIYSSDEQPDGDFDLVDPETAAADYATLLAEQQTARDIAANRGLEDTFVHARTGETFNLRWVYVHMIEEYARHNGHADLLREVIDGVTGE
jgi:hypothetical protein